MSRKQYGVPLRPQREALNQKALLSSTTRGASNTLSLPTYQALFQASSCRSLPRRVLGYCTAAAPGAASYPVTSIVAGVLAAPWPSFPASRKLLRTRGPLLRGPRRAPHPVSASLRRPDPQLPPAFLPWARPGLRPPPLGVPRRRRAPRSSDRAADLTPALHPTPGSARVLPPRPLRSHPRPFIVDSKLPKWRRFFLLGSSARPARRRPRPAPPAPPRAPPRAAVRVQPAWPAPLRPPAPPARPAASRPRLSSPVPAWPPRPKSAASVPPLPALRSPPRSPLATGASLRRPPLSAFLWCSRSWRWLLLRVRGRALRRRCTVASRVPGLAAAGFPSSRAGVGGAAMPYGERGAVLTPRAADARLGAGVRLLPKWRDGCLSHCGAEACKCFLPCLPPRGPGVVTEAKLHLVPGTRSEPGLPGHSSGRRADPARRRLGERRRGSCRGAGCPGNRI